MISSTGYANAVNTVHSRRSRGSGSRWNRCGIPSFVAVGAGAPATSRSDSSINAAKQLRAQLDQLQVEAEATRSKANSARLRLLRLSEAAEKLRRQAALEIEIGKEHEARELLLQKRKVMQALGRSKSRIELLDRLSAKLNEAISLKETQLIGNLTLLSEVSEVDADQPIHIISPRDDVNTDSEQSEFVESPILKFTESEEMESHTSQTDIPGENQQTTEGAARTNFVDGVNKMKIFLKEVYSFNNFMKHIDGHLKEIETDLTTLIKLSTVVMENEQEQRSTKVQQATQILEHICSIRRRIACIIQSKAEGM